MLLQRLVEYAKTKTDQDILPPFYARKPVRFLLRIASDGTPLSGLRDTADPAAGKHMGGERVVPWVTRASDIRAVLAVDTVEYVFGWVVDSGVKPERVAKQHEAFRRLIDEWAEAEPDGPARAIAAFYAAGHHRAIPRPEKCSRTDLVAFEINGQIASDHESAKRFWAKVAAGRKGLGRSGLCLVCGQVRDLLQTIPQQIPRHLLPGATQNASLVSINEAVHGFELTKFLAYTPICVTCGLTIISQLTALLNNKDHSVRFAGQGAAMAWWVVGESTFDVDEIFKTADPRKVRKLLAAPAKGRPSTVDIASTFCSVTVSGNVARTVVRDWVEQPLARIKDNVGRWFDDHAIVDWSGELTYIPLPHMIRVAGRWRPGKAGASGSWEPFEKGDDRPDWLLGALWSAALLNRELPPKLLAHLVKRIRADGRIDAGRAALIRMTLRRYRRLQRRPLEESERLTPALNEDNKDPAYLCGRLFAVLDELQKAVYWAARQPLNTSFAERYMGRAITNPKAVLVSGERYATAWLRRLRGPLGKESWAKAYAKRLDDIFGKLTAIPTNPLLTQQAEFILGFHHQRAAMHAERIAAAQKKAETDLPPDPDLTSIDTSVEGEAA